MGKKTTISVRVTHFDVVSLKNDVLQTTGRPYLVIKLMLRFFFEVKLHKITRPHLEAKCTYGFVAVQYKIIYV